MNETLKTSFFVIAALLVAGIAWLRVPGPVVPPAQNLRGQVLFADFKDPLAATSLEIVEYDEQTATVKPFKVAQINDRWCIPSHESYPADAKDHLASAATSLMQLKVLQVPSDSPGDYATYGVVDPDPKTLSAGTTGVGKRVTIRDKNDKVLLNLIIGKDVPGREGLRYVRVAGQAAVYVVALKTDKLSTRFEDWIEKDLLQLNAWDMKRVGINDYSVDMVAGQINPRGRIGLEYSDGGTPPWKLLRDEVFRQTSQGAGWAPEPLAPDEELNTAKLDELRTALDDLKIVDIARKPEGLGVSLRATGKLAEDQDSFESLVSRGFVLVPAQKYLTLFPEEGQPAPRPEELEVFSSEGEIRVGMKDGVLYVLRFGQVAGTSSGAAKPGENKDESATPGVNRYLLVMAQFDPLLIPKPELEKVPEPTPPAAAPAAPGAPPAAAQGEKKDPQKDAAANEAERKRIEQENKRKQDEYQDKLKKGEERVKELNDRFAAWYYVISDDVYRKVHLGRKDIVKKKEPPKEGEHGAGPEHPPAAQPQTPGDNVSDFETLKQEGLPEN